MLKCERSDTKHPQLKQEKNVYKVADKQEASIMPKYLRFMDAVSLHFFEDSIRMSTGEGWKFQVLLYVDFSLFSSSTMLKHKMFQEAENAGIRPLIDEHFRLGGFV